MAKHVKIKNKSISHIKDVYHFDGLEQEDKDKLSKIVERHPMRIPSYYYQLIDWDNPDDPIKKMSVPQIQELNAIGDYDTSGESSNTKMPGLQHKYQTTALVLSTNVCFMYCRHCFRKRMVGYSREEIMTRLEKTVDYVKNHPEINNVLITGGDSLAMSNRMVEKYLKQLSDIDHLDFIRFGTRSLVVKPERIYKDLELINIFKKYNEKKDIVIVTQFNHPREITPEAKKAAYALRNAGLAIRNQAVLLKDINDTPDVMANLLNSLTSIGIHPYYVFQCRPVKGVTHFQVPLIKGIDIINKTRDRLNGVSKGFRYIMSHPRGKIEIFDKTDDSFIFKFHQNKFEEDANMLFMKPLDENARWLDLDLNPVQAK